MSDTILTADEVTRIIETARDCFTPKNHYRLITAKDYERLHVSHEQLRTERDAAVEALHFARAAARAFKSAAREKE